MRRPEMRVAAGHCLRFCNESALTFASRHLSKPISVPKFIETIRRFLGISLSMPAVRRGNATAGRSRAARRTSS
jgi:hypothetical protein